MRAIDADALMELLTTAIRNMEGVAKFIGAEDDPEIRMEIKAYTDIANGVKDMPTIEPERKRGKWLDDPDGYKCSACGAYFEIECCDGEMNFCPNCGIEIRGVNNDNI